MLIKLLFLIYHSLHSANGAQNDGAQNNSMSGKTTTLLRGITWSHTRGLLPLLATAQRFHELYPQVNIVWETRSLQSFADAPIEQLAQHYDLLVIDHPFVGRAAEGDVLSPLDEMLPDAFLDDQLANSVGASHSSYNYGGRQWALAIDTAAPISGWRSDLLERFHAAVPQTWDDLLALARHGLVALPGLAIDSLMNFYMLCGALGEEPFQHEDRIVSESIGIEALRKLRELLSLCDPACLSRNPIATWQLLASGDAVAYCPFAYGYSNYSRKGYAAHTLDVGGLIKMDGRPLRSTLGGAGLAISSGCRDIDTASEYAKFVASAERQCGIYFDSGG